MPRRNVGPSSTQHYMDRTMLESLIADKVIDTWLIVCFVIVWLFVIDWWTVIDWLFVDCFVIDW